jgi:hypothetical protein
VQEARAVDGQESAFDIYHQCGSNLLLVLGFLYSCYQYGCGIHRSSALLGTELAYMEDTTAFDFIGDQCHHNLLDQLAKAAEDGDDPVAFGLVIAFLPWLQDADPLGYLPFLWVVFQV